MSNNNKTPAQSKKINFVCIDIGSLLDNVHFKKSLTIGGTLAGIRIPDDLILGNSDSLQNFNGPLTFASNVNIIGTLSIADKLNGFNLGKMCELFEPQSDVSPQKLTITGIQTRNIVATF